MYTAGGYLWPVRATTAEASVAGYAAVVFAKYCCYVLYVRVAGRRTKEL
jgi:hypothetical protein